MLKELSKSKNKPQITSNNLKFLVVKKRKNILTALDQLVIINLEKILTLG